MEKIKGYLFEASLLAVMFRSFIIGPSVSDAVVLITLVGAILYKKEYLNRQKIEDKAELKEDIRILKNEISGLKLDRGFRQSVTAPKIQYVEPNEQVRRF